MTDLSIDALFGEFDPGAAPEQLGLLCARQFSSQDLGEGTVNHAQACVWYGALRVAHQLQDGELLQRLCARYEPLLSSAGAHRLPARSHVADRVFGIVPLEIARRTGEPRMLEAGLGFADAQWATTTADGLSVEARYWVDDLFMIPALQLQAFRASGQAQYLERAALTARLYLARLQQPSGLFHHTRMSPVFWGRGNGWVAVGLTELLLELPAEHLVHAGLLSSYVRMMNALLEVQDFTGGFRQLLNVRDSWLEMSSTAMFTCALVTGVRRGWLDLERFAAPARDAWHCLVDHVDPQGNLSSVCPATSEAFHQVGADPSAQERYYLQRPRQVGDAHGQAPLLWAAAALLAP
jgi:unsaturated rhamnogalacturonyl hydrolase